MNRRLSLILNGLALLSLMTDLVLKSPANIEEAMWACYWAAASIIVGMLLKSDQLVSWGVVFFVALGLPAWLLSIFLYNDRFAITSILMHIIPLVAGLYYLSGLTALPKYSAAGAWMLYAVPFGLSWRICRPSAMINLSHWARWPLSGPLHHEWQFYAVLMMASGLLAKATAGLLNQFLSGQPKNAVEFQTHLRDRF